MNWFEIIVEILYNPILNLIVALIGVAFGCWFVFPRNNFKGEVKNGR